MSVDPGKRRVIFTDAAGRSLTLEDLGNQARPDADAGQEVPAAAVRLHQQARAAGGRGDYEAAHQLLDRAHDLAPAWPYPIYDKAFTYLLQDESKRAEQCYADVDRLAPRGFFTVKRSLDCLRREHAGELPAGFCKAFATLEWMDDKAEKQAILEAIVEKHPSLAAAWKDLSVLLDDDDAKARAIDRGLEHDPDPDTKGILLINRAMLLERRGDHDEAVKILATLVLDPESSMATEALARMTLAGIVS